MLARSARTPRGTGRACATASVPTGVHAWIVMVSARPSASPSCCANRARRPKPHVKKTSKRTGGSRKRSRRLARTAPAHQALAALARLARRERVRWYVFGAEAVNLYGFPRRTADLDVTIDLQERDPMDFVSALQKAGFLPRFPDEEFIRSTRVIPVVHRATGLPVDLVLAGPGLEQLFLDRAGPQRIAGTEIPVIAPEHLVITKLLAGRPKDLEDVRELLALRRDTLDDAHITELLIEIEQALGRSDLLRLYRSLRDSR